MLKYIFFIKAYFYLSLQRIFVLIRSNPENKTLIKYLKCAYSYMINTKNMFDYKEFEKFKVNLIECVNDECEWENIEYILYEDKKYSLCDNLKYIDENKKYLIDAIKCFFELSENKHTEQLYDLADVLHAFVEAVLIKRKFGKKDFFDTYIDTYNKKWKTDLVLFV